VLQLRGLAKHYGKVPALKGLDLTLSPGEVLGYLGPNGAGKTTTLRLVLGLLHPTAGEIVLFGQRMRARTAAGARLRERLGYLPGELSLYGEMSGHALLDYFARFHPRRPPPLPWQSRLREAFGLDKITLARRVKLLSHGTRQKLGLVLSMQHQPELLLLDEPTLGLDPFMQQAFATLIRELAQQGKAILFSSHILSEVERLCQRVALLRAGELIALETISALRHKMVRRMTLRTASPPPGLGQLPGVLRCERQEAQITLWVQGDLNPLLRALATIQVDALIFPEAELEDVLAQYYRDDRA